LAKSLDQVVEDFRTRPLDGAPYAYVTLDALVIKCLESGRTVNVCVLHAVGLNRDGFRESLGLDVVTSEDGAAWQRCRTHFMRNLPTRVTKSAQGFVAMMVRTIFAQPDAATVHEQHRGKMPTTSVRRRISLFSRSSELLLQSCPGAPSGSR
jgi:transposase-like protein